MSERYKNLTGNTIVINDLEQWEIPANAVIDVSKPPIDKSLHVRQLIAQNWLIRDASEVAALTPPVMSQSVSPDIIRQIASDVAREVAQVFSGDISKLSEKIESLAKKGVTVSADGGEVVDPEYQKVIDEAKALAMAEALKLQDENLKSSVQLTNEEGGESLDELSGSLKKTLGNAP